MSLSRDHIVEEIKSRCDIVEVIGRAVALKKAGGSYKGLCPFHNEKTPSFTVSETKQMFYCFGCNESGDVINFVQKYYNLDFPETVEKLASQYGIDTTAAQYKSANKEELYEINRKAARFFYEAFSAPGNPAAAYMRKRGIEPAILKRFGVGYADSAWDSLLTHFKETADIKLLVSLGLIIESKGKFHDKFRNRVMFPIINASGKVIGFGGRALGDANPKYLNSNESAVFLKKNNLFGLNLTKQEIGKENRAVLVEGYMDVISLFQYGVRNTCASLGTAFTENQARLLKRYTGNTLISYDGDEAGQAAATRSAEILYKEGLKARVLQLPAGDDPDDYIKKNGKQAFLKLSEKAPAYAEYRLEVIKKKHDLSDTEGKVDFIKEAVLFLKTLSPVEAEIYIKYIARNTNISEAAISLEYNGKSAARAQGRESREAGAFFEKGEMPDELEKNLIRLMLSSKGYFERIKQFERVFASRYGYEILKSVEDSYRFAESLDIKALYDSIDERAGAILQEVLENVILTGNEEQALKDYIRKIEYNDLAASERDLILKLSMADEAENASQINELTKELISVQREMQKKKS